MEPARKRLTVEAFFDACPNDQRHCQFFDGVTVAMAPPGSRHQVIAGRLGGFDHFETDFSVTCQRPADKDRGAATVCRRRDDGSWQEETVTGAEARLRPDSVRLELALGALYEGVR